MEEPLKESFYEHGHHHELVKRIGDVAIYKRWSRLSLREFKGCGRNPHFEVVVIQHQPEQDAMFKGVPVHFTAKELYPTQPYWGKLGWTYQSLERAEAKFQELLR